MVILLSSVYWEKSLYRKAGRNVNINITYLSYVELIIHWWSTKNANNSGIHINAYNHSEYGKPFALNVWQRQTDIILFVCLIFLLCIHVAYVIEHIH